MGTEEEQWAQMAADARRSWTEENPWDEPTAPGTEPIRQNRETPPRHVRWLIAGATVGFILGMGAMEALS